MVTAKIVNAAGISLCNLCVLCVSVVKRFAGEDHRRDTENTENTEIAQRNHPWIPRFLLKRNSNRFISPLSVS